MSPPGCRSSKPRCISCKVRSAQSSDRSERGEHVSPTSTHPLAVHWSSVSRCSRADGQPQRAMATNRARTTSGRFILHFSLIRRHHHQDGLRSHAGGQAWRGVVPATPMWFAPVICVPNKRQNAATALSHSDGGDRAPSVRSPAHHTSHSPVGQQPDPIPPC